ncbi:MAG TPA: phosphoribosyltransferase family protein [Verrucomicrobiae bacterium]
MKFRDRFQAGRELAAYLTQYAHDDVIVLALPRGGVPVAYEVARELQCPLDVFMVRKLGLPGHEELAMGAIATGGVQVLNQRVVRQSGISTEAIRRVGEEELRELERREELYREGRAMLDLHGRTVILVDDGMVTGSTMRAAVLALRHLEAAKVVAAVPVAAPQALARMQPHVGEVVTVVVPEEFTAVGEFYQDFEQTSDEEVCGLLHRGEVFCHG